MTDAPLIVDASVALKWLVEEEGSDAAEALRTERLATPPLIRIEVANVCARWRPGALCPPSSPRISSGSFRPRR